MRKGIDVILFPKGDDLDRFDHDCRSSRPSLQYAQSILDLRDIVFVDIRSRPIAWQKNLLHLVLDLQPVR